MTRPTRVYVLSKDDRLAAKSDYGPGWERAWTDPEGRRLLPFREPPAGRVTMTADEARAYVASFPVPDEGADTANAAKGSK